jgi:hypothetical protein
VKFFINNRASNRPRGRRRLLRRVLDFLILVVVLWLAYVLAGRSLRQVAVAQLAELTNAKIKAQSIDFNFDGSVSIEKLLIRPEQRAEYDDAVLRAEKVYARFDIGSLLLVRPRLREVTVSDFLFNAQQDLDAGLWNTAGLKFDIPKGGAGQVPVVRLEKGTVQYSKVSKGRVKVVTKVPIDATFEPAEESPAAYSFRITTAEMGRAGKSTLKGSWQPGRIIITGGISSTDVPSLERSWEIKALAADLTYDANNTYSLQLKIKDLLSSGGTGSEAFAFDGTSFFEGWHVFNALQRFFARYQPAGQIDIDLEAKGNLERLVESRLAGKVYCKDVSIRDVRFPYLVEHIAGEIDFTDKRVSLNNLRGDHDGVDLTFNGWSRDFGPDWQYDVRIKSDNMDLDNDLYLALNPKQKEFWSAFSPGGTAAIDYTLSRRPREEEIRNLQVNMLDVEANYENFPYPLKNLAGDLLIEHDDITISDLVSQYNGRTITLNGKVTGRSTNRPIYDVSISAKDVPLDSELASALPEKQRSVYEQFDMNGLADAEIKVFTLEPNAGPTSFTADVSVTKTSLKLQQLPLVVNDISARAVVGPNSIILEDFRGNYDQGTVSLTGRIWPSDQDRQSRYCLKARAEQMQLNDNVTELLPASLKKIVSDWHVKGRINLTADLNKAAPSDCPDHKLIVDCLNNSLNFSFAGAAPNDGTVGYKPAPYPLKDVTGRLIITNDSIKLDNITAAADVEPNTAITPTVSLNGEITLADDTICGGRLRLSANDVPVDERLGRVLPEDLHDLYVSLSPGGRIDLNFEDIQMSGTNDGRTDFDFSCTTKLKACSMDIWPAVTDMNAVFDTNSLYTTGGGFSRGRATALVDSFKVGGRSITSLKAGMSYDGLRQSWLTDSWVADCYSGKLTGKLEFKQPDGKPSQYMLQVGFNNIDLERFLSEPNPDAARFKGGAPSDEGGLSQDTRQELQSNAVTRGKMSGSLSLTAGVGRSSSRVGRCRLIITDMYVGKPSPLAKLLYVLQLTDSKDFVFERMFVDSYIKNDRVFFEKFDLSGESLAFNGSGSMDLPTRDVNLTLTVRGKRLADAEPSVLQSLAEDIGGYVVRMDVTGNAYDPDVKIKTLPVIRDSLNILGKKTAKSD